MGGAPLAEEVICFSLEPWDEVWRRNQLLVNELAEIRPNIRVLFAELPVDVGWSLRQGKLPTSRPLRPVGKSGRVWAMSPYKLAPRRLWPWTDQGLTRQVLSAAKVCGLVRPVLWVNDANYAGAVRLGWPTVYDVTDDWLLAAQSKRGRRRLAKAESLLLAESDEVVVCSPGLQASRGRNRPVHLIPNGVDVDHFRRPQGRPEDLPPGPILVYVGTVAKNRVDFELCRQLCTLTAGRATLVLVGPIVLSGEDESNLRAAGAILLGPRPYEAIPGYLQHADVIVVPHVVSPFTESLDPIKAREVQAVGRPAVVTPVAGFRGLPKPVVVAAGESFLAAVEAELERAPAPPGPGPIRSALPTWKLQAGRFLEVLDAAVGRPSRRAPARTRPPLGTR